MKISDYIATRLEDYVKHVFLVSGGGCIHLVDSFSKSSIKLIPNLHEQASAICAESYSQYTNKLGVVLVTTGPGATNALTGVASAWMDSTPMLVLAGQVQSQDMIRNRGVRQFGYQEVNTIELYKSITKYATTVTDPSKIRYHLEKALYLASAGRPGPVILDIPIDIQAFQVNEDELVGFDPAEEIDTSTASSTSIDFSALWEDLSKAKRPILLVGNGVRLSKAETDLYNFIHTTNIPVLATYRTLDFFGEDFPQYVGMPGNTGHRGANINQQNSDFIICIGARLDLQQTAFSHQNFARNAKKCIIDIDEHEINKFNINIDYKITMDAKEFLTRINCYAQNLNCNSWLSHCKKTWHKYPVVVDEYLNQQLPHVNLYSFIDALSAVLNSDSLVITGSAGACIHVPMQAIKIKKGMRVYNSPGLESMGFGLPASIGGALASGKTVICINGEGGLFMNIQELELIHRYNLPIKLFVLNNDGYGTIKTTQNVHFDGHLAATNPSSGLTLPSVELNAAAYKIAYVKIINQSGLKNEIDAVMNTDGPVICEVFVDKNHRTLPKAAVFKKPDGSFATRPMEDLFPFLERQELYDNLFIVDRELYE